jgi:hypothetical protein
LWMFQRVMFGPVTHDANRGLSDLSPREVAVLVPVLVLIVWIGVYPQPFLRTTEASVRQLLAQVNLGRELRAESGELRAESRVPSAECRESRGESRERSRVDAAGGRGSLDGSRIASVTGASDTGQALHAGASTREGRHGE